MTTNNDHAAALELWEAMGEVKGLRPKNISLDYDCWKYQFPGDQRKVKLEAADALHILTGHAQDWLQRPERWGQWNKGWACNGKSFYWDMGEMVKKGAHCSLPEAIRAEAGRG